MSMMRKRWFIKPPAPRGELRKYDRISPVLAQVLYNRGLTNPQDAFVFLLAKDYNLLDERFNALGKNRLKDIDRTLARLRTAIARREKIVIYGDFDADGVTSTTLLTQTLLALGADVEPYIPHRIDEGYGLNSDALWQLARQGVKLVITVDCGIRSIQEVEDGKAAGLDIIITDHHSVGPELPAAYAIVNPQQTDCKYPEKKLAGVGVAFKLAEALLRTFSQNNGSSGMPRRLKTEDLLDLVAIGTVADLMPLDHLENRLLVRRGLDVINQSKRLGIRALLDVAGIAPGTVTATTIGFAIGPRINAAGRLDSAMLAYQLLSTESEAEAKSLAEQLQSLNIKRQDLTREAQELVRGSLPTDDTPLIFHADEGFPQGIVGLVAGRLVEEFYRPAVIVQQGPDESHGSCRSIPQFDITRALDKCADLLVRHGGHMLAAGFTVSNQNIASLRQRLITLAHDELRGQELIPTLEIDAVLDPNQLDEKLVEELSMLEPMGYMFQQPIFATRNARVLDSRTVGKDSQHLKLRIARAGQPPLDAIGFGLGAWASGMPERIDLAYHLEINEWNGRRSVQMNLEDIRAAGSE